MELHGPNSDSFEMRVIGYHSAPSSDDRDSNRLRVYTRASFDGHAWTVIHPILQTWEILELAEWLDALATSSPPKPDLKFLEPNVSVQVERWSEERMLLRVCFERDHRPVWLEAKSAPGEVFVELECTPEELKEWAADLRQQIEKFPLRGSRAAKNPASH
jgi:hypothetical protein